MRTLYLGLIAAVLATTASMAQAQGRQHDGFMLRFTGGIGYGTASEDTEGQLGGLFDEWSLSGGGFMFSADVGGSFVDDLVLHFRFGGLSVVSPTVEFDGMEADLDDVYGEDDSSLTFVLLGPAITYYIMPANIYLTGAFGLGAVGVRINGERGSTDAGWAMNFDVGWEFWVGQSWGLGPALRVFYTSVPDGDDLTVNGSGFGVLFSATFQ